MRWTLIDAPRETSYHLPSATSSDIAQTIHTKEQPYRSRSSQHVQEKACSYRHTHRISNRAAATEAADLPPDNFRRQTDNGDQPTALDTTRISDRHIGPPVLRNTPYQLQLQCLACEWTTAPGRFQTPAPTPMATPDDTWRDFWLEYS
jgi:hypothetical protein